MTNSKSSDIFNMTQMVLSTTRLCIQCRYATYQNAHFQNADCHNAEWHNAECCEVTAIDRQHTEL